MKAYLANALFSKADQMFNAHLAGEVRKALPEISLYVPQENEAINAKDGYADSLTIYSGDNAYLDQSDLMIAVLDGAEIDSGVAAEVGRFTTLRELEMSEHGKASRNIVALYTDVRQMGRDNELKIKAMKEDPTENQFFYRNLYVIGAIKKHGKIFSSVEELVSYLHNHYN